MHWKTELIEKLFPLNITDVDTDGANIIKHQNRPASLFKFRKVTKYAIQDLFQGTVWLADPDKLNDPYDCAYSIDLEKMVKNIFKSSSPQIQDLFPPLIFSKEAVDEVLTAEDPFALYKSILYGNQDSKQPNSVGVELWEIFTGIFDELTEKFSAKRKERFNVCSFSEKLESLLMWAHYADEHRGFCMEYDMSNMSLSDPNLINLYPVLYSSILFDASPHVAKNQFDACRNGFYLFRAALLKSKDWEQEGEWRLVIGDSARKNGQSYPLGYPKAVYLGSHIKLQNQRKILNICRKLGIACYKMKLSSATFSMKPVPLDVADT